jgi:Protein of unknwon function (DUF3008)
MPAKSQKQQKFFGIVHGIQKGTVKPSSVSKKAQDVAKHISKKSAKDYASTKTKKLPVKVKKTKKVVKENYENKVGLLHIVLKPHPGCDVVDLVHEIDPIMGATHKGIDAKTIHGVYGDQDEAMKCAEGLHKNHLDEMKKLEEKKGTVAKKLTSMIDKLESKRKDHMKLAKENPDHASEHKQHISQIQGQIEDLMDKLEKVAKSKKEEDTEEDEDGKKKKKLKEGEGDDMATFENMLKNHDWYYMMSDSDSEYNRGYKQELEIKKMMHQLGDQAKELYRAALIKHFPNAKIDENTPASKYKVGDIVIPNKGPHKGEKHKVIHVYGGGKYNIKPLFVSAQKNKYHLGAAGASEEDLNEAVKSLSTEQKMVETFLKRVAKEFGYSTKDAASFVIDTIKKMKL